MSKVKSSRSSQQPIRSWCHRHTMIKPFWSQSMAPWTPLAAHEPGEKTSTWPTTNVKLRTSGFRARTHTGAGVTTHWDKAIFNCSPWQHMSMLRPKKLYTSVGVIPAPVWVPTQRPLVPSFTSVVGLVENFSPCIRICSEIIHICFICCHVHKNWSILMGFSLYYWWQNKQHNGWKLGQNYDI